MGRTEQAVLNGRGLGWLTCLLFITALDQAPSFMVLQVVYYPDPFLRIEGRTGLSVRLDDPEVPARGITKISTF